MRKVAIASGLGIVAAFLGTAAHEEAAAAQSVSRPTLTLSSTTNVSPVPGATATGYAVGTLNANGVNVHRFGTNWFVVLYATGTYTSTTNGKATGYQNSSIACQVTVASLTDALNLKAHLASGTTSNVTCTGPAQLTQSVAGGITTFGMTIQIDATSAVNNPMQFSITGT